MFQPEDEDSKDGVTLTPGEFTYSAEGQTLTIRAPQRTYRFNLPDYVSKSDAERQIAALGREIARTAVR